ncbi:hypothetical protein D047_0617A, partial [Vibrio parahaemolyticus VPTS-2010_2]
MAAHIA